MKFDKLYNGKLIKRYKRFLADIEMNGEIITAHVPNSGAMTSTIKEGCEVYVTFHDNPKRKLKYTLELSKIDNSYICVNTNIANKIGVEAIQNGIIKELQGYTKIETEKKYGKNSRIDIFLENEKEKCYVEIKSVTLKIDDELAFPDAKTARGVKHLHELIEMKKEGHRAVMLFIAQRSDSNIFRIAKEIDNLYFETLKLAIENGVEVLVYQSKISLNKIEIEKAIEFKEE